MNRRTCQIGLLLAMFATLFSSNVFAQRDAEGDCPSSCDFVVTEDSYSILINSASIDGVPLDIGDIICVYDGDLCVGSVELTTGFPVGLAAWEDDSETTEVDGFVCGNPVALKVIDVSTCNTYEVCELDFGAGDGTFCDGTFAQVDISCAGGPCSLECDFTVTEDSYSVLVNSVLLNGAPLEVGDRVCVYDGDLCVGGIEWPGVPEGLAAWQDDSETPELDGYVCGNEMSFKVVDVSECLEYQICAADFTTGDGSFCSGTFSVVDLVCGASPLQVDPDVPPCPIPAAMANEPYPPGTTFLATGGTPPYAWSQTGLPAGLDIDSVTGDIVGTAASSGNFAFVVTVTDDVGVMDTRDCSLEVAPEPVVIDVETPVCPVPMGAVGDPYPSGTVFVATGGLLPYAWEATGLPAGMTINSDSGELEGTPSESGDFGFSVVVTDDLDQTDTRSCFVSVVGQLTIDETVPECPLPAGVVNEAYPGGIMFVATGGLPPYVWSASGLPSGMEIDADSGELLGTPAEPGTFDFSVMVSDQAAGSDERACSVSIDMCALACEFTITEDSYSILVDAAMIDGLSLEPGDLICVYDGDLCVGGEAFDGTFPVGLAAWEDDSQTEDVVDGYACGNPISFRFIDVSACVALEPSAAFTTGDGTFCDGTFSVVELTYPPVAALEIDDLVPECPLPAATLGAAYPTGIVFTATGGVLPYVWSASGLPMGMGIDVDTGEVYGSPSEPGDHAFIVTVIDGADNVDERECSILVECPDLTVAEFLLSGGPTVVVGEELDVRLMATVANPGDAGAGGFSVGFYISSDDTISPGDELLVGGIEFVPGVPAGTTVLVPISGSMAVPDDWPIGDAYLGLIVDVSGDVMECSESNNTASIPIAVELPIGDLEIDVVDPECPLVSGVEGETYPTGTSFTATGGVPPYTWSVSGLPMGMNIDTDTGEIYGTPSELGMFPFTVTVLDQVDNSDERMCSIDIETAPCPLACEFLTTEDSYSILVDAVTIDGLSLEPGDLICVYDGDVCVGGAEFEGTFPVGVAAWEDDDQTPDVVDGYTCGNPISFRVADLSECVEFDLCAALFTAGDGTFCDGTFSVVELVCPPDQVMIDDENPLCPLAAGVLGEPYPAGTVFTATGGVLPYVWSASGLPLGMDIDLETGEIFGTPSQSGEFPFTVTVTDAEDASDERICSVTIQCPDLVVNAFDLSGGGSVLAGEELQARLDASVRNRGDYDAGGFAVGFYLSTDDVITPGDELLTGGIEFLPGVAAGATAPVPINGAMTVPEDWPVGVAYLGLILDVSDDVLECSESNNTGVIRVEVELPADDLQIDEIAPSCPLAAGTVGEPYPAGTVFMATGGVPPYAWSASGLPMGLDIDADTGELRGTPGEAGMFPFTVMVLDDAGDSDARDCSIQVNPIVGACCLDDGACEILKEEECLDGVGTWVGGACDPNPCTTTCYEPEITGFPYEILIERATKLGMLPLEIGDEIGVFDVCDGEEIPVGSTVFDGNFPITITAWQADPTQDLCGFTMGHPIVFRLCPSGGDADELCGRVAFSEGWPLRGRVLACNAGPLHGPRVRDYPLSHGGIAVGTGSVFRSFPRTQVQVRCSGVSTACGSP